MYIYTTTNNNNNNTRLAAFPQDVVLEYIRQPDLKYLRALGAACAYHRHCHRVLVLLLLLVVVVALWIYI